MTSPLPFAVVNQPPYEVSVSGYGSFKLPVHIHFSNKEVATLKPYLHLYDGCKVSTELSKEFTFRKPNKNFRDRLLLAGGRQCTLPPVSKGGSQSSRKRVLTERRSSQRVSKRRKNIPPKNTSKGKRKNRGSITSSEDDSTDFDESDIYTSGSS